MPDASAAVRYTVPPLRRLARPELLRALRVDQLRSFLQVALVQKRGRRNVLHVVDVGHVAPGVGEGELLRLDLQVHAVGAVDRQRAQLEVLEHAERHQRDDALAVGRDLVQRVAAVIHGQGVDPVRLVRRHVGGAHRRRHASSHAPRASPRTPRGRTPRLWWRRFSRARLHVAGNLKRCPGLGGRPSGRKESAKPGWDFNSGTCFSHCPAMVGETRKPSRP